MARVAARRQADRVRLNRTGNYDLWLANDDGTGLVNLTENKAQDTAQRGARTARNSPSSPHATVAATCTFLM
ncbi:MAG: hypothetical protein U0791_22735 [Gemmataceae bacterium]